MRHPDRDREHYGHFLASFERAERKARRRYMRDEYFRDYSLDFPEEVEARADDHARNILRAFEVHHG